MKKILAAVGAAVLLLALVIGASHWQLNRLEGADIRWKAPVGSSASVEVVGDVVLALSRRSNTMAIIDSEGGSAIRVDVPAGSARAYVGADGSFATVAESQVSYFSSEGEPLWTRDTDDYEFPVVAAIGGGVVTFAHHCSDGTCTIVQVDARGEEKWRFNGPPPLRGRSDEVRQPSGQRMSPPAMQVVPEIPALRSTHHVQQLRDGRPVGPRLAIDADAFTSNAIVVGDILIGVSHAGTECRYSAAGDGKPLWEATADCAGVLGDYGFKAVELVASADRAFATYATDSGNKLVVSINLATGDLSQFILPLSAADNETSYRDYALTPQAIVSQDKRQLTAYSPTTGTKLWERTIKGHGWSSDEDAELLPGVEIARGAVGTLATTPGWTEWAVGRNVPLMTSTFYDLATGDEIGRVAAKSQGSIHAEGADQVYLVADGQLMRIDTD